MRKEIQTKLVNYDVPFSQLCDEVKKIGELFEQRCRANEFGGMPAPDILYSNRSLSDRIIQYLITPILART